MSDVTPAALLNKVCQGEAVLFLGAGASIGATSDNDPAIPLRSMHPCTISRCIDDHRTLPGCDGLRRLT